MKWKPPRIIMVNGVPREEQANLDPDVIDLLIEPQFLGTKDGRPWCSHCGFLDRKESA
jgi:hypothetical protein